MKTPQKFNYKTQKHTWVEFADGRDKMKLRQFINGNAQFLSKVNDETVKFNRQRLINVFNNHGIGAINELIYGEVKRIEAKRNPAPPEAEDMKSQDLKATKYYGTEKPKKKYLIWSIVIAILWTSIYIVYWLGLQVYNLIA